MRQKCSATEFIMFYIYNLKLKSKIAYAERLYDVLQNSNFHEIVIDFKWIV